MSQKYPPGLGLSPIHTSRNCAGNVLATWWRPMVAMELPPHRPLSPMIASTLQVHRLPSSMVAKPERRLATFSNSLEKDKRCLGRQHRE